MSWILKIGLAQLGWAENWWEFVFLKTLNYDYSVWDDSYDYMTSFDKDYIESNYVDDTFKSLKIDGVFIYDMNFKQVYGHTFDYIQEQSFELPEFDLNTHLPNRTILPYKKIRQNASVF